MLTFRVLPHLNTCITCIMPQTLDMIFHPVTVVERPLCDWEAAGSIPGWVIPKTLKMVLAAPEWRSALRK